MKKQLQNLSFDMHHKNQMIFVSNPLVGYDFIYATEAEVKRLESDAVKFTYALSYTLPKTMRVKWRIDYKSIEARKQFRILD